MAQAQALPVLQWMIATTRLIVEPRLAADRADDQIGQSAVKGIRAEHERWPGLGARMAGERDIYDDDVATPIDNRRARPPRLPKPG